MDNNVIEQQTIIPVDTSNSVNKTIRTRNMTNINKASLESSNKDDEKNSGLKIYQKYLNLVYYTNDIVRKYPKKENFSLVQEIKTSVYSGLKNLIYGIKVYNKYDKLKNLNELDINLTILKVQVRISYKYQYITTQNYESWSNLITDICNMLGGWISSCQKR